MFRKSISNVSSGAACALSSLISTWVLSSALLQAPKTPVYTSAHEVGLASGSTLAVFGGGANLLRWGRARWGGRRTDCHGDAPGAGRAQKGWAGAPYRHHRPPFQGFPHRSGQVPALAALQSLALQILCREWLHTFVRNQGTARRAIDTLSTL